MSLVAKGVFQKKGPFTQKQRTFVKKPTILLLKIRNVIKRKACFVLSSEEVGFSYHHSGNLNSSEVEDYPHSKR